MEFSTRARRRRRVPAAGVVDFVAAAHDRVRRTRQTRLGSRVADHAADPLGHAAVGAHPRTQRRQSVGCDGADARVHAHRLVFRLSLDRATHRRAGRVAAAVARGAGAHAARHRPAAPHAARRSCAICTPSFRCCPSSRCISRFPWASRASRTSCWASPRSMPDWLLYTPMGLTVRAINERDSPTLRCCPLDSARRGRRSSCGSGLQLLRHQLRHGVVAGGARDAERGPRGHRCRRVPASARHLACAEALFSAVQSRELTLLQPRPEFPRAEPGACRCSSSAARCCSARLALPPRCGESQRARLRGVRSRRLFAQHVGIPDAEHRRPRIVAAVHVSAFHRRCAQGQGEALGRPHARLSTSHVRASAL